MAKFEDVTNVVFYDKIYNIVINDPFSLELDPENVNLNDL
jgi:hypothetical protein